MSNGQPRVRLAKTGEIEEVGAFAIAYPSRYAVQWSMEGVPNLGSNILKRKGLDMTTDERLEKLERQLATTRYRYRWLAIIAGVLFIGSAMAPPAENVDVTEELRTRRLVIEDQNGGHRVLITTVRGQPALVMLDENGKGRISLAILKSGPSLDLLDSNGRNRLSLFQDKIRNPTIQLNDMMGRGRASLKLNAVCDGSLTFFDDDGRGTASFPR